MHLPFESRAPTDELNRVITLTLLPSLSKTRIDAESFSFPSTSSIPSLDIPSSASFPSKLLSCLLLELDSLLHWDLPIATFVQFNEVGAYPFPHNATPDRADTSSFEGRATHVRDVVDVRDVVETFVPLAKRIGWVTRRLTGLVSSTVGAMVLALVSNPTGEMAPPIRLGGDIVTGSASGKAGHFENEFGELMQASLDIWGVAADGWL